MLSMAFASHTFAASKSNSKIYIQRKSIMIGKKKICVKTKNGVLPVTAIHSDKNGYFVLKGEILRAKRTYYCPWYGHGCNYTTTDPDELECHLWQRHRGWRPGER
jgi:hypothetical protein